MQDFKPGDVVQLRSGGPLMTVKNVGVSKDVVECVWFADAKDRTVSDTFPSIVLKVISPPGA